MPEWISNEVEGQPSETVVLEGSPNVTSQAPQQIFVQGQGGPGMMMMMPTTNAVLALVLGILGIDVLRLHSSSGTNSGKWGFGYY